MMPSYFDYTAENFQPLVKTLPDLDEVIEATLEWWTEDKWVPSVYENDKGSFCALGALGYQLRARYSCLPENTGREDVEWYANYSIDVESDGACYSVALRYFLGSLGGGQDPACVSNYDGHAAAVRQLKMIAENFRVEKAKILADA